MWIVVAVLSAFFAGLTAVLSKCGNEKANSDVVIALRVSVIFVCSWIIVLAMGAHKAIADMSSKAIISIVLSGVSTGACWICYFKALSIGDASKVSAVDKSSVALSVLFAIIIFPDERNLWWVKLICLVVIVVGTALMTDIKRDGGKRKIAWLIFALLSAVFSTATSLLGKIGTESVDSNCATALRTCVILVMAWLIVFCKRETKYVKELRGKEIFFLILSGITTTANWFCYYYAIQKGQVSIVVPIDKMSILVTVVFSLIFLKEKLSVKAWFGLALLTAGTVCMAVFT
ncbi:MAG: EamA family transporter [Clostridia bacterium]|nr:EamA family transporter [Clostridia bacterium]